MAKIGGDKWQFLAEKITRTGRKREYTLDELKQEFVNFVNYYCENTIVLNQRTKQKQKGAKTGDNTSVELYGEKIERIAPMTEHAFCLWIGRCRSWFPQTIRVLTERKQRTEEDEEYLNFLLQVQTFLSTQMLEGAIIGEYVPSMVSSVLGMKSNIDVTSDGKATAIPIINIVEDKKTREEYDAKNISTDGGE